MQARVHAGVHITMIATNNACKRAGLLDCMLAVVRSF
jgi:hypothetical protein